MNATTTQASASNSAHLELAEQIAADWASLGAAGSFLARNLNTGAFLGFNQELPMPLASVSKVLVALVALDLIDEGALDPAEPMTIDPETSSFGATGIATYRYPVTIAVADLLNQMLSVSDNAAADVILDLVGLERVNRNLRQWGCAGLHLRHRFQRMYDCAMGVAGNDFALAREYAIDGDQPGGHHKIETLNIAQANVGTASALIDVLERVWQDTISTPRATAELRRLMAQQLFTHRLSSDLGADSFRVSAKTGSFLHLRHEIGVVETDSGVQIAIGALTRSTARARVQNDLDLAIGAAARIAVETLR